MLYYLQSHKAVSKRKVKDFTNWHKKWLRQNVSPAQQNSVNDWFMGKCDGLVPNKTHKIVKSDLEKAPFHPFVKFRAEVIKAN